jgi:hypothetical protein
MFEGASKERHECKVLFDELDDFDKAYERTEIPLTAMSCSGTFFCYQKNPPTQCRDSLRLNHRDLRSKNSTILSYRSPRHFEPPK